MTTTVITGSSTGIGYATALRLARDGHDVIATMRTPASSDLADVADKEVLKIETRALDVTDQANVDELFADVLKERGSVDVLVNNAGISIGRTVEDASIDEYVETMETNYFGALRCTKAVLPGMREQNSGAIVSVTSQAGRLAVPTMSPYCGSKWALEGVMEVLSAEVAQFGIRVALIEPGAIITPIMGKGGSLPSDTPYGLMYHHFMTLAIHDFGRGSSADVVADTISEAISTKEPKLRWPCGQGAQRNLDTRAAMTDEEFVQVWNLTDDDAFKRALIGDEAR